MNKTFLSFILTSSILSAGGTGLAYVYQNYTEEDFKDSSAGIDVFDKSQTQQIDLFKDVRVQKPKSSDPIYIDSFTASDRANLPEKINSKDILNIQGYQYQLSYHTTPESGMRYRNVFEILGQDQHIVCTSGQAGFHLVNEIPVYEYTQFDPHPLCSHYVLHKRFKDEYPDKSTYYPDTIRSGSVVKQGGIEYVLTGYHDKAQAYILERRPLGREEIVDRCHLTINPYMTEVCMSLKEKYQGGDIEYIYSDKSQYTAALFHIQYEANRLLDMVKDNSISAMDFYSLLQNRRRLQFLQEDYSNIDNTLHQKGHTDIDTLYKTYSDIHDNKRYFEMEKYLESHHTTPINIPIPSQMPSKSDSDAVLSDSSRDIPSTVQSSPVEPSREEINTITTVSSNHPIHIGEFVSINGPDSVDPFDMTGLMVSGYDTQYVYMPVAETTIRHGFEAFSKKGEGYLICHPSLNGTGMYTHDRYGKNIIEHYHPHPVCDKYFNHNQEHITSIIPDPSYDYSKDTYSIDDLTYYQNQWYIYHGIEDISGYKMWSTYPTIDSKKTILCNKKNKKHHICQLKTM